MKNKSFGAILMSLFSSDKQKSNADAKTAYDFSFKSLKGGAAMPLSAYEGKVILVVNTASKCGLTGQYEGLEKLSQDYGDKGLVVIGVPSNDFGAQEPGTEEDIASFCALNYGVSFPMTAKEKVIGEDAHPFYRWAHDSLGFMSAPKWNFHKYLVGKDGKLVGHFISTTTPDAPQLLSAINDALDA